MKLDYSTRMQMTLSGLTDFLERYKQPDHLSDATSMAEMKSICDAINARMSADIDKQAVLDRLADVFQAVSEQYLGAAWPKAAVFVKAMDGINKRRTSMDIDRPAVSEVSDALTIAANRINSGESVGEEYLYGRLNLELMATGDVTDEALKKCRTALFFNMKRAWGDEKALHVEGEFMRRHERAVAAVEQDQQIAHGIPTQKTKDMGGYAY